MTLTAVSRDERNDIERVALLQATRLLDAPGAPPAIDALVRQLAAGLRCPLAAVNLVDAHRVWSLASVGSPVRQVSRDDSLCWLTLREGAPLLIDDVRQDPRSSSLAVSGPPLSIRAYAGIPLMVEGQALGVLCAMEQQPRAWRPDELATLRDLGTAVSAMIESALHAQRARLMEARMRAASLAGGDRLWEAGKDGVLTWVSAGLLEGARRSDQLLRQAIESFQISVMITDPEGRVVLSNQNWKDLNRSAHDDATGCWRDTLLRLLRQGAYPDAVGREDAFLSWRLSLHEQTGPAEIRFLDRWLLLKDHRLPDQSVVHFAMDITQNKREDAERQLAAEKLRVSEELYRSVAANISDGLVIVELSGRVVALNPAASRILGVSQEELQSLNSPSLLGLTLLKDDLVTPLPVPQWPISETLAKGARVVDRVHPLRRPDGEIVWVQVSSHLLRVDSEAPPFAAMATLRDITRERHAQQALQFSEERWKFALEGAGDGVWDWDLATDRVYFSQRWKAMLGHEDREVGNTMQELIRRVHPDDQEHVTQGLAAHFSQGESVHQAEFRLRHRDGHYLAILSRGKVVSRDRAGMPLRIVGTHSDITPVKQAERVLREKQSAEAASRAKSEFLSRMSHEIRTPLNAIHGFAQLLQLQLTQQSTGRAPQTYVEQILQASHHLMGLVNDVLDLQQVEAGILSFKPEDLLLATEVEQCLSMLAPLADKRGVSLFNTVAGDWRIHADRRRLRQVVMNLGSNAIKYNEPGGEVRVAATPLPDGELALTIDDTGAGMSPQQLSRLFQPFERLGRETSTIEGTGLGLIITRSLIEAMGGRMDIYSRPGAGTKIGVVLPVSQNAVQGTVQIPPRAADKTTYPTLADLTLGATALSSGAPPPATSAESSPVMSAQMSPVPSESGSTPPLRVLYVEDNRINALLFEEALRPFPQIDLEVAEDGQMALSLATERAPDVLVLDAHLPGMSGFEVLQALRQLPHVAGVPAFMCSADAMPEDVARAKAAGFTGYWTKPIDIVAVTKELCRLAQRGDNAAP